MSVVLDSRLGAACSAKLRAGAPDNEADALKMEEAVQRSCVVHLLWGATGISARSPRGCALSAPDESSGITRYMLLSAIAHAIRYCKGDESESDEDDTPSTMYS